MKNKMYIIVWILLIGIWIKGVVGYGQDTIGYFPPQPKDVNVLVMRPNISMQLIVNDYKVQEIDMKLNGKKVDAQYDRKKQAVFYQPDKNLSPGFYKVDLRIVIEGFKPIVQSWQFAISKNAVKELQTPSDEQKRVVNYSNRYRKFLKLPEFQVSDALNAAAMAHSNYMSINKKLIHDEFNNDKGFIGVEPYKRAGAFGYMGSYIEENLSLGQKNYKEAIDDLIDAPYHRLSFINPDFIHIGYGKKDSYYTFDFGGEKNCQDTIKVYPMEEQKYVDIWWEQEETPNPLRIHNKKGKVGYPISLSYFGKNNIKEIVIEKATLKNKKNNLVEIYLNTPQNDDKLSNSILIIPTRSLEKNEKYNVYVKGKIIFQDGKSKGIEKKWSFQTVTNEKDKNKWMKDFIYDDIKNHWAKAFIIELGEKEIITSKVNNLYKPDDFITRGEFAEFIVNALEIATKPYKGVFKDVRKNTQKNTYIEAAFHNGIIKGMGDGTFHPNDAITREEMAVMIIKAYEKKNSSLKIKKYSLAFKDEKKISSWAYKYVKIAYELGIIKGRDKKEFAPQDFASRGEAAVMIKKLLEVL
ncbi:S-layer homology domain-containing protein [Inediibacterium massiliense]|uniref:CAP and S-layer homology domain-containing protein n=1 Tax=Inediibacterium massiliense TaxID=1658111 RepID=UPI0006B4AD1F|nr:S-layer homology domain-containing protein [Inediibacterium massiliense]